MEKKIMKATICTTHGKTFRCAGLEFTPDEQDFEIDEAQLAQLKRAEKPRSFKGPDGRIHGGGGVLRVKVKGAAPKAADPKDQPPKGDAK